MTINKSGDYDWAIPSPQKLKMVFEEEKKCSL